MRKRRLAVAAISDDEDDDDKLPLSRVTRASNNGEDKANSQRKRKKVKLVEEEEEKPHEEEEEANNDDESRDKRKRKRKVTENEEEEEEERGRGKRNKKKKFDEEPEVESEPEPVEDEEEEVEVELLEDAKPIGEVIRVTGKGKGRRNHYESFEYDGNRYELEDPVLLVPEAENQKPYVAIIKDITQTKDGNMMVTGQWFYRPEEAQRRNGGNWQSRDTRELFYSFHRDEVPAESVMHKCVVHFIPLNKQIPGRKEHPGFIVQKVYDTEQMKLFKLTDKDYEDTKQQEIDLLVHKTIARVGHLPDIETEDNSAAPVSQEDQLKSKRLLRKKSMSPLDVTREDEAPTRFGQSKAETPGSCPNNASEYFIILSNFNVLTGETQRDKWLEKLLQSIQFLCNPVDNVQNDGKEKGGSDVTDLTGNAGSAKHVNESLDDGANGDKFRWPDIAVPAVVALEKAAHEALSCDFQKYNQKMRQLTFNLKNSSSLSKTFQNSSVLARRLLNGELDPSQILNMSPNELKVLRAKIKSIMSNRAHEIEDMNEPYDESRFMSALCEQKYLEDLVSRRMVLEKGIHEEKLAEKLPEFFARLHATGWSCFIPTPCKANEEWVREFYANLRRTDFENPQVILRGRLVRFGVEQINDTLGIPNFPTEPLQEKDHCENGEWLISKLFPPSKRDKWGSRRKGLKSTDFTVEAKMWLHILSNRVLPCGNVSDYPTPEP